MPSIQTEYQWLNYDGTPITAIVDMPEANPGTPSPAIQLKLKRTGMSTNIYVPSWPTGPTSVSHPTFICSFDNQPVTAEQEIYLGATLWNRGVTGGTVDEGSELVAESWLEFSEDGETWRAIGAGPDEDISEIITVSKLITWQIGYEGDPLEPVVIEHYMAVPATQTVTLYFRLNIPADAVTSGDFRAHLEVFVR